MTSKSGLEGTAGNESIASCDPAMTRKEFVSMVLKRGAIAGAILSAPAVIDKFLVSPACAMASSMTGGESGATGMEP
jgi:hypothetical protein